jgi:hypothetical protein
VTAAAPSHATRKPLGCCDVSGYGSDTWKSTTGGGAAGANAAPTLLAAFIVRTQLDDDPLQAPLQAENTLPVAGEALSVTTVPLAKDWAQPDVPLQRIPAGLDVTVPLPLLATCSAKYCTVGEKLAPTVTPAAPSVIVQVLALPEHDPLQPVKTKPDAGVAVSVTAVPLANEMLQPLDPLPQLIPAGFEVTVPPPPTVTCRDSS